ncbi:hypothetical protein AB1Y20_013749 [Prymnesium parvum]|uniref:Uncharacterized protein n=1 Tax=Prymnesium parvum TaxID=97485 RepID=A0AB34IIN3_PRYPA
MVEGGGCRFSQHIESIPRIMVGAGSSVHEVAVKDIEASFDTLELDGQALCPREWALSLHLISSKWGNDEGFVLAMLDTLLEEYRHNPVSVDAVLNCATIMHSARSFKGAAANLGLAGLSDTSKAVETIAGALALHAGAVVHRIVKYNEDMARLRARYCVLQLEHALRIYAACLNRRIQAMEQWYVQCCYSMGIVLGECGYEL